MCDLDTLLNPLTSQGISLTFDDGWSSVFTQALPLLRERRIPAHLFLTTGAVGQTAGTVFGRDGQQMVHWDQVEALAGAGVLIESHTVTHPDMRTLNDQQILEELQTADVAIERRLGRLPRYFAYPYGRSNKRIRTLVRPRYAGCVTTDLRMLQPVEDRAALPRLDSYYLRAPRLFEHLNSGFVGAYLEWRRLLRNIRGSHDDNA